jgi:transposase-like protein
MARKTYTEEFRVAAAKPVREQGYSVKKAARSLGVDPGTIRGRVRQYGPERAAPAPGYHFNRRSRFGPILRPSSTAEASTHLILASNSSSLRVFI